MRHGIALNKIHIQHAWEASDGFEVQICTVSLLVGELVGGGFISWPEPDSVWREQESGGIRRNPEESGVNTGIPVPQEFLQKIPVNAAKNRNSCDLLQNQVPMKNSSGKRRKKKKFSGILAGTVFLVQKINSGKQELPT
jgi:hypothetical protein